MGLHDGDRGRRERSGARCNTSAPYAGCAMAEYFTYKGQDALIVYDDLSKQAHRLSAALAVDAASARTRGLSRRHFSIVTVGSWSGPRKTERRAGRAGRWTALPIVEDARRRGFPPIFRPNVISIHRRADLLAARPVLRRSAAGHETWAFRCRVSAANAQVAAMKKVAGGLRLDPGGRSASWRRSPNWATDLDAATQSRLDRGYRMTETPKAGRLSSDARDRSGVEHLRRHAGDILTRCR